LEKRKILCVLSSLLTRTGRKGKETSKEKKGGEGEITLTLIYPIPGYLGNSRPGKKKEKEKDVGRGKNKVNSTLSCVHHRERNSQEVWGEKDYQRREGKGRQKQRYPFFSL